MAATGWVVRDNRIYCPGDAAIQNRNGLARDATPEEITGRVCAGCGVPALV